MKAKNIFDEGILIDLNINMWGARKKLRASDLGLDSDEIPDIFSLGRKWMIDKRYMSNIKSIALAANRFVNNFALPFPIRGVYFVPKEYIGDVIQGLEKYRKQYNEAVNVFVDDGYVESVKNVKSLYEKHWDNMKQHYPTASNLRSMFNFSWNMFQLSLPENGGVLSESEIREERNKIKGMVNDFAESCATILRQNIFELANNLKSRFDEGKIFKKNSIENILDLCNRIDGGLNFFDDTEITKTTAKLRDMFNGVTADEIRDDEKIKKSLSKELRKVVNDVEKIDDMTEIVKSYKRKVSFK